MEEKITLVFDMDGTIADLYGQNGWLEDLIAENPAPYANAKPLCDMAKLTEALNKAKKNGVRLEIISWLSKGGSGEYALTTTEAKLNWIRKRLPNVIFDDIHIVEYGTPKSQVTKAKFNAILFDDEERNRDEWIASGKGVAYSPEHIFEILERMG